MACVDKNGAAILPGHTVRDAAGSDHVVIDASRFRFMNTRRAVFRGRDVVNQTPSGALSLGFTEVLRVSLNESATVADQVKNITKT